MDPELCPPWWPELIWWLLHHHHVPPTPEEEWRKRIEGPIEELMGGLAVYVQAEAFVGKEHEDLRQRMQATAHGQMSKALGALAQR